MQPNKVPLHLSPGLRGRAVSDSVSPCNSRRQLLLPRRWAASPSPASPAVTSGRCQATTKKGTERSKKAQAGRNFVGSTEEE